MGDKPRVSFCILTTTGNTGRLDRLIASIRAQRIPEYEVIVAGVLPAEMNGIVPIHASAEIAHGDFALLWNRVTAQAIHEWIVVLDDCKVLSGDWFKHFSACPHPADILTSRVYLEDGGRYWDHAELLPSGDARLLGEFENADQPYLVGGNAWAMRASVAERVRWNEAAPFAHQADLDFAADCLERGIRIQHNAASVVYHLDPRATNVGRRVLLRPEGFELKLFLKTLVSQTAGALLQTATSLLHDGTLAEAADVLRYGIDRYPDYMLLGDAWQTLQRVCGGELPQAHWFPNGTPEFRRSVGGELGAPTLASNALGINMIGFFSGNLGLGVTARQYLRLLDDAGLDVCPVEVPVGGGRANHDHSYAERCIQLSDKAPHRVNLFMMNPGDAAHLANGGHDAIQFDRHINLNIPFWELPRMPNKWLPQLEAMDVVIAASQFVKYALMADLSNTCIRDLPHPLYLEAEYSEDRAQWGIPRDAIAFVSAFEMASDVNRKNPYGAIEAFNRAFGARDNAVLVVKVNNSRGDPSFVPHMDRLEQIAAENPRIILLDRVLSYSEVLSLYASSDALVSLHRAEGLGLCPLEAMTLGKPVVATGWSGNMDFMTEKNACLVGYKLVPVEATTQAAYGAEMAGPNARWADPNLDEAAYWMVRLAEDESLRRQIGKQAAADMAERQRRIDPAEIVTTVRNLAERRGLKL